MKRALIAMAIVFTILGCIFIGLGFDKKNNYYSSDTFTNLNKNAYVGGDAYNYIINANYFTGYIVLGCTSLICASMFLCFGLYMKEDETSQQILFCDNTETTVEENENNESNSADDLTRTI